MLKSLNNLGHAYLLIGSPDAAEKELHAFFAQHGKTLTGSPDFFVFKTQTFGVDEARQVSVAAVRKPFTERKVFLIVSERLTLQAQNALLKTFEDPYPDTHFFLVAREEELIIPTLRSRMQAVHIQSPALNKEAEKFLKFSLKERLSFVKKFVEQEKNISVFLDELLLLTRSEKIYHARLFSDDRGVSPRLILEHLAVVL
ncbi:MAG: hypothetical protein HYT69_00915 [Candidatus Zambryskibacteria bacterium]|nr:hypothetical protein [Candidatus Zambryskibacteria bacterium]